MKGSEIWAEPCKAPGALENSAWGKGIQAGATACTKAGKPDKKGCVWEPRAREQDLPAGLWKERWLVKEEPEKEGSPTDV